MTGSRSGLVLFVFGLLALHFASCRLKSTRAGAPGKSLANVKARCENGATITVGAYKYENNQWGSQKAHGAFEQCLLERAAAAGTEYGWTWDFPGFDPSVYAYPEIIFGWKPWSGGPSSDARFPLRIAEVGTLSIAYEVETEASGNYNLAPEVWLTSSKGGGDANPRLISAEIMFWMESKGGARPAGSVVDHPKIGDLEYELWKMEGAGDKTSSNGWTLFSFKAPERKRSGTIPVDAMLRYMVNGKLVNPEHFVASVEFGNEISGGAGTTWVKRFQVDVRP